MECKFYTDGACSGNPGELIETLWNVNMEVRFPNGSRIIELIETLWNVN